MPRNTKPKPDADTPEWTAETFRHAKRLNQLPENVQAALKRNGRGPQKTPTKQLVSIRLSADVLKALRATGDGWQGRVDETLRARFLKQRITTDRKVKSAAA